MFFDFCLSRRKLLPLRLLEKHGTKRWSRTVITLSSMSSKSGSVYPSDLLLMFYMSFVCGRKMVVAGENIFMCFSSFVLSCWNYVSGLNFQFCLMTMLATLVWYLSSSFFTFMQLLFGYFGVRLMIWWCSFLCRFDYFYAAISNGGD